MIIGITGGIGCGKSTTSKMLAIDLNAHLLTVDIISKHILLSERAIWVEVYNEFAEHGFDVGTGNEYYPLDTVKLRNIIFDHDHMRVILENILLFPVRDYISTSLRFYNYENFIIDSALLFESGLNEYCDTVILVTADPENQLRRASLRDSVDENQIAKIISKQLSVEKRKTLLKPTDFIIENNSTLEDLTTQLKSVTTILQERYLKNETN